MQNSKSQAGNEVQQSDEVDVTTSSPNNAKPIVGCCTSLEKLIEHIDYLQILNFNSDIEYIKEKAIELQKLERQQILNTFKDAQALHAMGNNMRAEQYFNNTFKK
jgi:hypothetical protein